MAPEVYTFAPIERKRNHDNFLQDYPQVLYKKNFRRYHTYWIRRKKRKTLVPLTKHVHMHSNNDIYNEIQPALNRAYWSACSHLSAAASQELFDAFWRLRGSRGLSTKSYAAPVHYTKRSTLESLIEVENKSDAEIQAQKAAEKVEHDTRVRKMMAFIVKHKELTVEDKAVLINELFFVVTQWETLDKELNMLETHRRICKKIEQVAQAQTLAKWKAEEPARIKHHMEVMLCRVFKRLRIEDEDD